MGEQHSRLFDLPAELRLVVYSLILPSPKGLIVYSCRKPDWVTHEDAPWATPARFFGAIGQDGTDQKCYPAILATCRQIYDEAKSTLYQPLVLELLPGLCPYAREELALRTRFAVRKLRLLPPLQKLQITITEITGSLQNSGAHSLFLTDRTDLETEELIITIHQRDDYLDSDDEYRSAVADHCCLIARLWLGAISARRRSKVLLMSAAWGPVMWQKEESEEWKDITPLDVYSTSWVQNEREKLFTFFTGRRKSRAADVPLHRLKAV